MGETVSYIPSRLKSAVKDGHVAGAVDIVDDELNLNQATINSIVMANAVTLTLKATSNVVDSSVEGITSNSVTLVAEANVDATISIKRGSTVIASGSGSTLSVTDNLEFNGDYTTYTAEVSKGGYSKSVSVRLATMYYGAGSTSLAAKYAKVVSSPAGTYNVTVNTGGSYVFFRVPESMSISRATKNGFDYPLSEPVPSQIGGDAYKDYYSSNTYDAGTENIVLY